MRSCLLTPPHVLIPMFEQMLYDRESGELWYYDENGNFVESHFNCPRFRHGCVLGAFLLYLAMYPVYARLHELLGPNGALYAYSDVTYLITDPINMARTLAAALSMYGIVGLRIGWGPSQTELILPPEYDPRAFLALHGHNWRRPTTCRTSIQLVPRSSPSRS